MAVPRNRHSNARKNSKRAHHAKKPLMLSTCSNCGTSCISHRICGACGFYGGKAVVAKENAS